ncbi:MAG: glycosyltransferase [Actinomycetota bacterium]|nr:glycosyltransferase [Actinomycetota bacterium]
MKRLEVNHAILPKPAEVQGNRWTDIPIPDLGDWVPEHLVSVILPHYEAHAQLDLTLAALTRQTYPTELIEIVVVDDGSRTPPVIPDTLARMNASVHVQEHLGFGAGKARNLGASVAVGDILVFLDCDMIPEPQHIEAHARWHHAVSDAAVVGFRWHANFETITPSEISNAVEADSVRSLLGDQEPLRPQWIDRYMTRTHRITTSDDDAFRIMSGGNLSVRRQTYLDVGGTDETFGQWGGEDNEVGFRLVQHGTVVVPDEDAVCWHQGEGHLPSAAEVRSLQLQRPKLQNLIAELGFRKPKPGRSYTVPYAVCSIDGTTAPAFITALTIESVLESLFHDLIVVLDLPLDSEEAAFLQHKFVGDHRVELLPGGAPNTRSRFSPLRIEIPVGVLFHDTTLTRIVEMVRGKGVGLLHLTIPGRNPSESIINARLTRALNRAERLAVSTDDVDPWIGQLFGERWEAGRSFGLGAVDESGETTPPVDPDGRSGTPSEVAAIKKTLARTQKRLQELQSRRSVRLANAVGRVERARSWSDLLLTLQRLGASVRRR